MAKTLATIRRETRTWAKLNRLSSLKEELRQPKERLMRVLAAMEDEGLDASLARRLGTIIGRLEDLQRRMP